MKIHGVVNTWIYYATGPNFPGAFYKIRIDGTDKTVIFAPEETSKNASDPNQAPFNVSELEEALSIKSLPHMENAAKRFINATNPGFMTQFELQFNGMSMDDKLTELPKLLQAWINDLR